MNKYDEHGQKFCKTIAIYGYNPIDKYGDDWIIGIREARSYEFSDKSGSPAPLVTASYHSAYNSTDMYT